MSPVDFAQIIPRMRNAIEEFSERRASQGVKLTDREAIVEWMEKHYESWFRAQVGIAPTDPITTEATRPVGGPEKRRHRRLPVELSAYYRILWTPRGDRVEEAGEAHQADVKNISAGGLYIVTGRPYPLSTLMEIQFELAGLPESVCAFAMVVWRQERSVSRFGHGLHFSHIETRFTDLIDEAIMEKLLDAPVVNVRNEQT